MWTRITQFKKTPKDLPVVNENYNNNSANNTTNNNNNNIIDNNNNHTHNGHEMVTMMLPAEQDPTRPNKLKQPQRVVEFLLVQMRDVFKRYIDISQDDFGVDQSISSSSSNSANSLYKTLPSKLEEPLRASFGNISFMGSAVELRETRARDEKKSLQKSTSASGMIESPPVRSENPRLSPIEELQKDQRDNRIKEARDSTQFQQLTLKMTLALRFLNLRAIYPDLVDSRNNNNHKQGRRLTNFQSPIAPVNSRSDAIKISLWLNIYSLLSMHAIILHGLPTSLQYLTWQAKKAVYNVGGFDFSLLEIEHAILRGSTHHPSGLLGMGSFLPEFSSQDPRATFRGTWRDPRVGFALSFCTVSNPRVRVLNEHNLNRELNRAVVNYLEQYLDLDEKKKIIWLPKICDWFWKDFGKTKEDMLQWVASTNFASPSIHIPDNLAHFQHFFKTNSVKDFEAKFFKYEWGFKVLPQFEYPPGHILWNAEKRETVLCTMPVLPLFPSLDDTDLETLHGPPSVGVSNPRFEPEERSVNSFFARSTSTYPNRDPETGRRDGHPIADAYVFKRRQNRIYFALADGCGWGGGPREAAHAAATTFVDYLSSMASSAPDTRALGRVLLNALDAAHSGVVLGKSHDDLLNTGSTTICGGVAFQMVASEAVQEYADSYQPDFEDVQGENMCRACKFGKDCPACKSKVPHCWEPLGGCAVCHPENVERMKTHWVAPSQIWGVALLSIGDCKAYHYRAKTNSVIEITRGNRQNIDDPTDPGGRIGPFTFDPPLPDLRNLRLIFTTVAEGDYIYLCSDGVHDNLDPQILGIDPGDFGIKIATSTNNVIHEPSWEELGDLKKEDPTAYSSIELLKSKWSAMKMQSLMFPDNPRLTDTQHHITSADMSENETPEEILLSDQPVDYVHFEGRQRGLSLIYKNKEPGPTVDLPCLHGRRLLHHCQKVTQSQRDWMESKNEKVPLDYKTYPGKLDHTTLLIFRIFENPKN